MRPRLAFATAAVLVAAAVLASPAGASFGVASFSATARDAANRDVTQAGAHPDTGTTSFTFNNLLGLPSGNVRNVRVDLPPGLISNPQATFLRCSDERFPSCPPESRLGTETLTTTLPVPLSVPIYNMEPKPGQVSLFAFNAPIFGRTDIVGGVRPGDSGLYFTISNIPQLSDLVSSQLTFWGMPSDHGSANAKPFITLPTACGTPGTTKLTVESWQGETATATTTSAPATGCDRLPFTPSLEAVADGRTSAGAGAGLVVTLRQPPDQANVRSVSVQLPAGLAARGSTVTGACPEATFASDPTGCANALVGTVHAETPLLSGPLDGPVYLVAHPAGLPTIEALLNGAGVGLDLSGTVTFGASGITSAFNAVPDVPITRFVLDLPPGPHSALSAPKGLCGGPLTVGATIVAHSGARVTQQAPLRVTGCTASAPRLRVLRVRVKGATVTFVVAVPRAGKLTLSGRGLRQARRRVKAPGTVTLTARLRQRHHHHRVKVRVTVRLGLQAAHRTVVFG
jgi:hypothetical protein